MSQECSTHAMSESCPACRVVDHYETQLQLARLQEENRRLLAALDRLVKLKLAGLIPNADNEDALLAWDRARAALIPSGTDGFEACGVSERASGDSDGFETDLLSRAAEGVRDREARRAG
jgi:hypothetical protein